MDVRSSRNHRDPTVTFWGGVRYVTGSIHLVEAGEVRVLLDCGLALGRHPEVEERNRTFPAPPKGVAAVVLSHAHVDHCGNLPRLVRQGFEGPIYCTAATRDLLGIMLTDSARIQEQDAWVRKLTGAADECSTGLLYDRRDVERTLGLCVPLEYGIAREIRPGWQVRLADAGHLLGSAMIALDVDAGLHTRTIVYSGDLGRSAVAFLQPPAPMPTGDLILCESTYGGRRHVPLETSAALLQETVLRTFERGGKVLIPAFSLGRTHIVVAYLRRWMAEGLLPRAPIRVDSPLAAAIDAVCRRHPRAFLDGGDDGNLPSLHWVEDREESLQVSRDREPAIVVASGGMCEAGRILDHFEHNLDDPRNSVVLVSWQAPGSLGRKLLEKGPTVSFRGRRWNKWADVVDVGGFSAHADHEEILGFLRPSDPGTTRLRLVHGDLAGGTALAASLETEGFADVRVPERGEQTRVA